ncbi:monofunctional biosynthetic peptidoglycan transglycosylase [Geobacter sp. OR-1]|uniref:transglycosylase domain-containing protein n=1 Tax=Geobacter sp. OR-1 TaxID=1266765 RepID=UPI0005426874|nr:biosynthetic peptidoglycan transglycosylase [Geobacter sp. OR-1]GAM11272.1 monofunctional biosynthetic peptidoglycan transglycosylase [Geobacter sp. OR-1]
MKKIVFWCLAALLAYLGYIAISLALLPPVSDLKNRKASMTITVKDWQGEYHQILVGPKNRNWVSSGNIPAEMKWAVILAEDANFYKHEGVDVKAIKNAIKHDLEKKALARGASTITQQTAKNLYLSREKTVTRKLKELYLALRMEQELTKGRIVELYLNVVELGPMVYGIGHGSRYYFGKPPSAMTPRECAFLAAMLPGPRVAYNPYKNLNKVLKRSDMILGLLRKKGVLSEDEYRQALGELPNIGRLQRKVDENIQKPAVLENMSSVRKAEPAAVEPGEQGKDGGKDDAASGERSENPVVPEKAEPKE